MEERSAALTQPAMAAMSLADASSGDMLSRCGKC